jgi:hypothetical protein
MKYRQHQQDLLQGGSYHPAAQLHTPSNSCYFHNSMPVLVAFQHQFEITTSSADFCPHWPIQHQQ